MANVRDMKTDFVELECSAEDSEFTVRFAADQLVAYHINEIEDLAIFIDELCYYSKDGVMVFRAETGGLPSMDSCHWNIYSVAQDIFSEASFDFHGSLPAIVGAMQFACAVLDNFAPTAPSASNLRDESE